MDWDAFWIIATGSLLGICCGFVGIFLILRRMAMLGDAISHAVLPGIVVAFLLTGTLQSFPMLVAAALTGLLTVFIVEMLQRRIQMQSDAAIGITYTSLFATGIIMISLLAGEVDLDQECVLFGEIAYVPMDVYEWGSLLVPKALVNGLINLLLVLLLFAFFYKELVLSSFDEGFALAAGLPTGWVNYLLMGVVSFTTVNSFESVGAILVVALLVVVPATAYLLAEKLPLVLLWVVLISIGQAAGGYYLAVALNASIGGSMVSLGGAFLGLVLVGQWLRRKLRDRGRPKRAAIAQTAQRPA